MYCDEVQLEADTVLATLYVAKKYIVPHLARACVNYLETSLTAKNACLLLSQSRLFEEPDLMQRCWEVIDAQVSLNKGMLKSLTFNDNLNVTLKSKSNSSNCLNNKLHDSEQQFIQRITKINNYGNVKNRLSVVSHCFSLSENNCCSKFNNKRLSFSLFRTRSEPYFPDNKLEIEVTQNVTYEDNFVEEYEHNRNDYNDFSKITCDINPIIT